MQHKIIKYVKQTQFSQRSNQSTDKMYSFSLDAPQMYKSADITEVQNTAVRLELTFMLASV